MPTALDILPEATLADVVATCVRLVEGAGAGVIVLGVVAALVRLGGVGLRRGSVDDFLRVRFVLGRFLALGLELQLAADILRTAVAPSFRELGVLATVAAIRTALNFFLEREIDQERGQVHAAPADRVRPPGTG